MESTAGFSLITTSGGLAYGDNTSSDGGYELGSGDNGASEENKLQPVRMIIACIHIMVCFTGLIGNGVILYTLLKTLTSLSVTDMYILSLAISDFLFLLTLPFAAKEMMMGTWVLGKGVCKLFISFSYLTLCAGVLNVMAMSIDRFQNVVFAIKMMGIRTIQRARIIIMAIWAFSVIYMLPATLIAGIGHPRNNISTCTLIYGNVSTLTPQQAAAVHTVFRFVCVFFVPFVVMVICNTTIVHFIRKRRAKKDRMKGSLSDKDKKVQLHMRQQDRVTKLILLVTTVFLVCFLPNLVLNTMWVLSPNALNLISYEMNDVIRVMRWSSVCLLYINSALNPFLYAFSGGGFRQRIKEAIVGRRYAQAKYLKEAAEIPKSPQTAATRVHFTPQVNESKLKPAEALPLRTLVTADVTDKRGVSTTVCYNTAKETDNLTYSPDSPLVPQEGQNDMHASSRSIENGKLSPEFADEHDIRDPLLRDDGEFIKDSSA